VSRTLGIANLSLAFHFDPAQRTHHAILAVLLPLALFAAAADEAEDQAPAQAEPASP